MSFVARGLGIATVAAAAALGGLSDAMAADPPFGAAPPIGAGFAAPADDMPVTFATGWYLRGDVGMSSDVRIAVGGSKLGVGRLPNNWSLGVGAGYKFNDWMRTDVTVDYRATRSYSGNTTTTGCITAWNLNVPPPGQTPTITPCSDIAQARVNNTTALVNVYGDLGTWAGITPYIGAGIGVNYLRQTYAQNWYLPGAVPYDVTATDAITPTISYHYNLDQARSWSSIQLAWALMAGVAYTVTPNLTIDLGGRFLNLGKIRSYSNMFGIQTVQNNTAKEIRIGFRYTPD